MTFSLHPELLHYFKVIKELTALREEAKRVKLETSPWFYISGGFSSQLEATEYAIAYKEEEQSYDYGAYHPEKMRSTSDSYIGLDTDSDVNFGPRDPFNYDDEY